MASDEPVNPRFKELLEEFERQIRDDADLGRLKVIRRQIRKTLPLSVRAYLPAYLLQEAVSAGVPRVAVAPESRVRTKPPSRSQKAKRREGKQAGAGAAPTVAAASELAEATEGGKARLFVSVGRSRRVSRQMLVDLFIAKLELPQEQIGEVIVLDHFSFIELPTEVAQSAIDRISGETLNGRRVTVDYARSKRS